MNPASFFFFFYSPPSINFPFTLPQKDARSQQSGRYSIRFMLLTGVVQGKRMEEKKKKSSVSAQINVNDSI